MKVLLLICSLLALTPVHAAEDRPQDYASSAKLTLVPGEGLQGLSLPWSVLQASRSPDLTDVRLFDAQGRPLPMAWSQAPAAAERERVVDFKVFAWPESAASKEPGAMQLRLSANGAVLDLQMSGGQAAAKPAGMARTWLIDMSALRAGNEGPRSLRLTWQPIPTGLSAQANLERSEDGQQWTPFAQGRLLELAAADAAPRIDNIAWPQGASLPRYVRLRLDTPLALNAASLTLSQRLAAPLLEQAVRFEPTGPAEWQLDLQGRIAPLALDLQLPPGNTLMSLRLEQRNTASEPWRAVSRFVAWRMQRGGVDGQSPAQTLQAAPARYWRLLADGPTPLQGQALPAQWHWQAPQLVLLAQGQPDFVLVTGRAGQRSAATALAALLPGYQAGDEFKLPQAQLGDLQSRPAAGWAEQLSQPEPDTLRRWGLWAVLIIAVLGLGWMARRLLRQISPP